MKWYPKSNNRFGGKLYKDVVMGKNTTRIRMQMHQKIGNNGERCGVPNKNDKEVIIKGSSYNK